ncbi:phosphotransferase [Methylomonas sp. LL1]|uniref:phosphotransferase n=1 Tax=Methylomonas sp. LL1 TaxID=2785785 RepID=UPI0018C443E8|nr:phosphotransferase [Methylomonas sp. LL1]QPK61989.1 phosphotransferase [Methylomonas sp. LL1]
MKNPNKHIVLHGPQDISVQWAQHIVNHYVSNAKVSNIDLQSIDVGTSTRLRVEVTHDAQDVLPARWFVKTPSLALKSRLITALPRFLHKEVVFYQSLSSSVPVKLPKILAAESRFGRGSTLVMTDLTELDFRPGRAADALSYEQASQVVAHLARLHGSYWNKPALLKSHRWLNGFSHQMENQMGSLLAAPLMQRGLLRAETLISKKLHGPALRYAANRRRIKRFLAQGAKTLVHYDCHPGNIFWTHSEPGFLDWQLVRMGEGIGDVAYFLATALDPRLRRKYESSLLNQYVNHLASTGVEELDEQKLFRRYRAHLVYPFEAMTVTLGIGGMMQHDSNLELIRRAAAAVDDHDSFALLEA